jgi:predicted ATP-grasp superfamily ATP-dependent carboligase
LLIGFAESLAAIECAWLLLDAGYRLVAFTRAGRRPALGRSRHVEIRSITAPEVDASAALTDLIGLVNNLGQPIVLPLDDKALWLCDRAASSPAFAGVVAGPTGALAPFALDKRLQLRAAQAAGLQVPRTVVAEPAQPRPIPETDGPWYVKPARVVHETAGRLGHLEGRIATTKDALSAAIDRGGGPLLVQERVDGVGEGLFGFCTTDGIVGWSAHRRIRMMNPAGSGSSACRSIEPDSQLLAPATRFLEAARWRGMFMLEFVRTADSQAWFMELNGRPWGSMALARRRGLPYPVWAVRSADDPEYRPDEPVAGPHVTVRNIGRELLHVAFVARGSKASGLQLPGLGTTLRCVLTWHSAERCYNLKRGELPVFIADILQTIASKARPSAERR